MTAQTAQTHVVGVNNLPKPRLACHLNPELHVADNALHFDFDSLDICNFGRETMGIPEVADYYRPWLGVLGGGVGVCKHD